MKILFLLTQDLESPSGLGRYYPMARELSKFGHEVQIAALHPDYGNLEKTRLVQDDVLIQYVAPMHIRKSKNTKTYYSPLRLLLIALRATFALTIAAFQLEADLIVVGKPHPMNSIAGLLVSKLKGIPLVLDSDDYEAGSGRFQDRFQRKIVTWFEDYLPRKACAVITNTRFNQQRLKSIGVPEENVHYIPNGILYERFQAIDKKDVEDIRRRYSLGSAKVVGYIGSLSSPTHPVQFLIDTFATVLEKHPSSVLLIIGGGQDYAKLKTHIEDLQLQGNIHLVGRVPSGKIPTYYRTCDITVEPVFRDDAARGRSPLKLFESWISHVPFITGDVGDRQELIGDPPAGVLVKPGSAEELAGAICELLTDEGKRSELAARGFERAQDYYWSHLSSEVSTILTEALLTC